MNSPGWLQADFFSVRRLLGFRQVVAQVRLCISELCRNMLSLRIGSVKREQMDPYTVQYLSRLAASGMSYAVSCSGPALKLKVQFYFVLSWASYTSKKFPFFQHSHIFHDYKIFGNIENPSDQGYVSMYPPHRLSSHQNQGSKQCRDTFRCTPHIAWILGLVGRSPGFR